MAFTVAATAQPAFDRLAAQARVAREQGKLADAAGIYKQAVALRPEWKEGWWYASTIFYDQQRYTDARAALQRFLALAPKSGEALALLGLCEFQLKKYEDALTHLDHARVAGLGVSALEAAALYHYAILLTRFEQYDVSGQLLLGVALKGEMPTAIVEAAGLAGLRMPRLPAEVPAGESELVRMAGQAMCLGVSRKNVEARRLFDQLVARYASKPNVHYLRGTFLLPLDPAAAFADFESELRLNSNHVPALVAIAMEHLNHEEIDKGLPFAERAVKADPRSVAAHAALGKVLTQTADLERAILELQAAVRLAPDSPQIRIALASAYAKAGRNQEAAAERAEFLRLRKLSEPQ